MSLYSFLAAYLTIIVLWGCSIFQSRVIRQLRAELQKSNAVVQAQIAATRAAVAQWVALARLIGPTHPGVQRVALLLAQMEANDLMLKARTSAAAKPARRWRLRA